MKLPPLVGAAEIQGMLGVSRQRVQQLINTPNFPRPVYELRMGKVWLRSDIETWMQERKRRAGPA
ncbi:MAG TPA: DNA-binding protein [Mycobacteriales bacterium]|nr:DNA-binding protein [Mycobacteriales bacterium]